MAEAKLPTEEEIAALPRWARVAFAARCVRRALPFCKRAWPDAPADFLVAVENNVVVTERAAANAVYVVRDVLDFITGPDSAAATAKAAAFARRAAADADFSGTNAAWATSAAAEAGVPPHLIASDFCHIRSVAEERKWDDSTPVPPSVFDSLDAPAPSPPAAPSPSKRLVIKAYMRPDADMQKVGDKLVELYAALNDYTLEKYGVGLAVEDFERFLETGVLDPVGVPS